MIDANTTIIPTRSRPYIRGYGIPEQEEGMLDWQDVARRVAESRNYWINTVGADSRPHAMPIWGIWIDDMLIFDGAPHTRWARNLATNPHVVIHLESGDNVVTLEGTVVDVEPLDRALYKRAVAAWMAKYSSALEDHGAFTMRPRIAFAWTSFPADATRFQFQE